MIEVVGAWCFGVVLGWTTYRSLRREANAGLSDIAAVAGAVGGAAITAVFRGANFGAYCIGLFVGFFGYLVVGWAKGAPPWMLK